MTDSMIRDIGSLLTDITAACNTLKFDISDAMASKLSPDLVHSLGVAHDSLERLVWSILTRGAENE